MSGPCLEISFELHSAPVVLKTEIRNNLPRTVFVFGCVWRNASVVCPEALLKVGGDAYITLGRDGTALKKIDILHNYPPFAKASGDALRSPKVF